MRTTPPEHDYYEDNRIMHAVFASETGQEKTISINVTIYTYYEYGGRINDIYVYIPKDFPEQYRCEGIITEEVTEEITHIFINDVIVKWL